MAKRRQNVDRNYYVPEQEPKRRRKRPKKKSCLKYVVGAAAVLLVAGMLFTPSSEPTPNPTPTATPTVADQPLVIFGQDQTSTALPTSLPTPHIYDNAEIRDVHNGFGTEVIGKFSLIRAPYAECTDEALEDWYFNHVAPNNFNWCMILYSDKSDDSGVYSSSGFIQKDVTFEPDQFDQYMLGDTSKSIWYVPDNDKLKRMEGF